MSDKRRTSTDNVNIQDINRRRFMQKTGAMALSAAPSAGVLAGMGISPAMAQAANTLVIAVDQDASSLKPDTWGPDLNWLAVRSMYDTLCHYNTVEGDDGQMYYEDGNLEMRIAESYEVSDDKMTVTWTIRDGMVFGSGNPIDAEAVVKSFRWYLERNEVGGSQAKVDGLMSPDKVYAEGNKVIMELVDTVPWGASANYITLLAVVDVDEIMSHATDADPYGVAWLERNATPSGPYQMESWTPGQQMVLTYREDWYGPKPSVERIIFVMIPDPSVRYSLLSRGEVHIATALEYKDLAELESDPNVTVTAWESNSWEYLGLNWSVPEFQDLNVRRAIACAIPIEDIIDTVYYGYAVQAKTPYGTKVVGADPTTWPYEYDVERAKAYLAESGYPDGFDIVLSMKNGEVNIERTAQLIVEALSEIGINVTIQMQTPAQASDAQVAKAIPMGMSSFLSFVPDAGYHTLWNHLPDSYANFFGYNNPEQAELGQQMLYMDPNDPERISILKKFQEIMAEDVFAVYLTSVKAVVAHSNKVSGFAYYPDYDTVLRIDNLTLES